MPLSGAGAVQRHRQGLGIVRYFDQAPAREDLCNLALVVVIGITSRNPARDGHHTTTLCECRDDRTGSGMANHQIRPREQFLQLVERQALDNRQARYLGTGQVAVANLKDDVLRDPSRRLQFHYRALQPVQRQDRADGCEQQAFFAFGDGRFGSQRIERGAAGPIVRRHLGLGDPDIGQRAADPGELAGRVKPGKAVNQDDLRTDQPSPGNDEYLRASTRGDDHVGAPSEHDSERVPGAAGGGRKHCPAFAHAALAQGEVGYEFHILAPRQRPRQHRIFRHQKMRIARPQWFKIKQLPKMASARRRKTDQRCRIHEIGPSHALSLPQLPRFVFANTVANIKIVVANYA